MAISAPLAQVLAAERARFNALFVDARHRYPTLDSAAFTKFLETVVDRIVTSAAAIAPGRVATVTGVAYSLALELIGQGLAGPAARTDAANRAWSELAPRYARLVVEQPLAVLGALTNASLNVEKTPSARVGEWLQLMGDLAPRVETIPQMRIVGQVAAWVAGVAHLRRGALHAADSLPEAISLAATGAEPAARWTDVKAKLMHDPWWSPRQADSAPIRHGVELGQFSGFGGLFHRPPEARACKEGFVLKSEARYYLLIADVFGAVFHAATEGDFTEAAIDTDHEPVPRLKGATLSLAYKSVDLDLPTDGLQLAFNAHTVAVTSPYTFAIRLFPRC